VAQGFVFKFFLKVYNKHFQKLVSCFLFFQSMFVGL